MMSIASITIAVFIAFYAALAAIFAVAEEGRNIRFYANLLITAAFATGAVMAGNFLAMLFFWEGLLIMLYLFLLPYNKETALKAFLINAAGDVVLLIGICLFYASTGTLKFNAYLTSLYGQSLWAFILIFTGAVAKAGAFPFHSWIAPAAKDASFSFMALLPATIEKLLAVFLLGKIFISLFPVLPAQARVFVCALGVITAAIAALRMLTFKDLRELLAWNIIMQIGLLIIALGAKAIYTEGDIFYIMNHGIFKAALLGAAFFAAGYYNIAFGGTTLADIRGAAKNCFGAFTAIVICALGLAGVSFVDILFVPNTLLIDSWQAMPLLAVIPAAAALITLFAFGKVIFALLDKTHKTPKGAWLPRTVAMVSFIPVLFFTFGFELSTEHFFGMHWAGLNFNTTSVICIVLLLLGIVLAARVKQTQYNINKDTYDYAKAAVYFAAAKLFFVDRVMDKLTDYLPSTIVSESARKISKFHRGNTPQYIIWAIIGIIVFIIMAARGGIQ